MEYVVCIKTSGVKGDTGPSPPNANEERGKVSNTFPICFQSLGKLFNHSYIEHIIKKLWLFKEENRGEKVNKKIGKKKKSKRKEKKKRKEEEKKKKRKEPSQVADLSSSSSTLCSTGLKSALFLSLWVSMWNLGLCKELLSSPFFFFFFFFSFFFLVTGLRIS